MKVLCILPAREIPGADQVLDGMVLETTAGNHCRLWPAMTNDAEAGATRIAFFIEWRCMATPDDIAEVTALTDEIMGGAPALFTEETGNPWGQDNLEWLRTGKMPPPKRAN